MRIDLAGWTREATEGDPRSFLALFEAADRLGFPGVLLPTGRSCDDSWIAAAGLAPVTKKL